MTDNQPTSSKLPEIWKNVPAEAVAQYPFLPPVLKEMESLYTSQPARVMEFVTQIATVGQPDFGEGWPKWRKKAVEHVAKIAFPTLKAAELPSSSVAYEARLLGHFTAWIGYINECDGTNSRLSPSTIAMGKRFAPLILPFLELMLLDALKKPRLEAAEFYRNMSFAMDRTIDENGGLKGYTDATFIYFVLGIFGDDVPKLNSVSELHLMLCTLFEREWDLDRTKKICSRIGLKFRAQGRPKKIKGTA